MASLSHAGVFLSILLSCQIFSWQIKDFKTGCDMQMGMFVCHNMASIFFKHHLLIVVLLHLVPIKSRFFICEVEDKKELVLYIL